METTVKKEQKEKKFLKKEWKPKPIRKTRTPCCALAQISGLHNDTTAEEVKTILDQMADEAINWHEVGSYGGIGQTAVFTICTPAEDKLKATLESIGFNEVHQFKRRTGYPQTGNLRMMIFNIL